MPGGEPLNGLLKAPPGNKTWLAKAISTEANAPFSALMLRIKYSGVHGHRTQGKRPTYCARNAAKDYGARRLFSMTKLMPSSAPVCRCRVTAKWATRTKHLAAERPGQDDAPWYV